MVTSQMPILTMKSFKGILLNVTSRFVNSLRRIAVAKKLMRQVLIPSPHGEGLLAHGFEGLAGLQSSAVTLLLVCPKLIKLSWPAITHVPSI